MVSLIGIATVVAFVVNLFYFAELIVGHDVHLFNAFYLVVLAIFGPVHWLLGFRLITGASLEVGSVLPWPL